jgi:hypothetical protein
MLDNLNYLTNLGGGCYMYKSSEDVNGIPTVEVIQCNISAHI